MAKRIIVKVRGAVVEITDPNDLPRVLRELGWNAKVQPRGHSTSPSAEALEDLYVALRMVIEAKSGIPARSLASAMGCKSPRAMAGVVQRWSAAAKQIGFDLDEILTRSRKRDHRVWNSGPKIEKALKVLEQGRETE